MKILLPSGFDRWCTAVLNHFPAWMVESAHHYLRAAEFLDAQHLMHVAQVNAAIGMEILLKSFVSIPDSGDHKGTKNETYTFDTELIKAAHVKLQQAGKVPSTKDLLTSAIF